MRYSVSVLLALVACLTCGVQVGRAQPDTGGRRGDLIEGILRTLVESQLDRQPADTRRPPSGTPTASPGLQQVRRTLAAFSQDASGMITALRYEERYSPAIRPLLSDALGVKAKADAILQNSNFLFDEKPLVDDWQKLDQQWRILASRLGQVPNLSSNSVAYVKRLDGHVQQLGQLLKVTPQLDYVGLIGKMMALTTNLQNLHDDMALDLRGRPDLDTLLTDTGTLKVHMEYVTEAITRNAPYDEVLERAKQGLEQWRRFAAKIRTSDQVAVLRGISRIDRTISEIHALMWIPEQVDPYAVTQLSNSFSAGVDALLNEVTLGPFVSTADPEEVVRSVKEFRQNCRNFGKAAAGNASPEDLMWDFRVIQVDWQPLRARFAAIPGDEVQRRLAALDTTLKSLSDKLQVQPVQNQQEAVSLSAALDELSALMQQDLARRLAQARQYSIPLKTQLVGTSRAFHTSAHDLHAYLIRGESEDRLRQQISVVAEDWKKLAAYLGQLDQTDRTALGQTYQQIVPQLARLQILLAY